MTWTSLFRACPLGLCLVRAPPFTLPAPPLRMLSPDGRCKTLDAAADGYGRSEAVLLLHLRDGPADGAAETILLLGSAVNQDGRSSSLTAPNGPAQQAVVRAALAAAEAPEWSVGGVQLHGTGTALGDPIEVGAKEYGLCCGPCLRRTT